MVASQAFGHLFTVPVAGTYANGTCSVQLKSDTFSGPCDARGFSGNRLSRKGEVVGSFAFRNVDELPADRASTSAPSPVITEPAYSDSAAAQAVLVPSYGRSRLLIEPGGGCSPAGQLAKGYCFDRAVGYLQRHRELDQVTVVTMTRSYLLGTWVPLNSGQGWNVYEVKRRGELFTADRDRQFTTKVNPPNGCQPGTMNDEGWLVTTSEGYKVAAEAKHYLCDPARSTGIVSAQGPRSLPGGNTASYNAGYRSPQPGYTRSVQPPAPQARTAGTDTINGFGSPAAFRQDDSGIIVGEPDAATPQARSTRKPKRHK